MLCSSTSMQFHIRSVGRFNQEQSKYKDVSSNGMTLNKMKYRKYSKKMNNRMWVIREDLQSVELIASFLLIHTSRICCFQKTIAKSMNVLSRLLS